MKKISLTRNNEPTFVNKDISHVKVFSPKLRFFRDEYSIGRLLGQGRFGRVHMCRDKISGKICAVKLFTDNSNEMREHYMREVLVLKLLDHKHIAKLVEYFSQNQQFTIV